MKIELKKIHHSEQLSQETNAYTADVYVNGKLLGHARNDGQGGCDILHAAKGRTYDDIQAVNEAVKKERGVEKCDLGNGKTFDMQIDLETVCHELLEAHLREKQEKRIANGLKRDLKCRIMFVTGGKIMQSKKIAAEQMPLALSTFKHEHVDAKFLNDMTFDQALAVFKEICVKAA